MAAFKFRLATMLKLREQTRDERRRELAEAQRAEAMLLDQITELEQQMAELRGSYGQAAGPGRISIDRLVDAQRYEVVLLTQQAEKQRQQKLIAQEVERRRVALMEADREVQILEKLREKQQAKHLQAEQQLEVKILDEVASRRRREEFA